MCGGWVIVTLNLWGGAVGYSNYMYGGWVIVSLDHGEVLKLGFGRDVLLHNLKVRTIQVPIFQESVTPSNVPIRPMLQQLLSTMNCLILKIILCSSILMKVY